MYKSSLAYEFRLNCKILLFSHESTSINFLKIVFIRLSRISLASKNTFCIQSFPAIAKTPGSNNYSIITLIPSHYYFFLEAFTIIFYI